jgi:hypothetical protein
MLRKSILAAGFVAVALALATAAVAIASGTQQHAMSRNFAKNADANCAALNAQMAPLGNPKSFSGIAHKLSIAIPAFTMALRAQAELVTFDTPAGDTTLASKWMSSMASYLHEMTAIRAGAAAAHAGLVTSANAKLTAIGAQAASLSKQLGLQVCFQ